MNGSQSEINQPVEVSDLYTIDGLVKQNPNVLTKEMLRWQLRHRHENGLASCCLRGGKHILISKRRYEQWLASQTGF